MAGLVPSIHVFAAVKARRGDPGQARTSPGMTLNPVKGLA
jgi:hypothetical protein